MGTPRLSKADLVATLRVVDEAGSFTKAAQQMYLTCPAVLYRVRQLEKMIGEPLYVRGEGSAATLTARGVELIMENEELRMEN